VNFFLYLKSNIEYNGQVKQKGKKMAKKTVKKAAAKKVAAVKPVAKPTIRPAVKKAIAKKAPAKKAAIMTEKAVAAPVIAPAAAPCGCHECKGCKSGVARFFKKLIIFLIVFSLGWCAAKYCGMKHHIFGGFVGPRVEFVNGCADVTKIPCPEMAAKLAIADVNGDGCITKEEFRTIKKELRKEFRRDRGDFSKCGGHRDCNCGANQEK
jgi:hypothetical protein